MSIVIPAKNEELGLVALLPQLVRDYPDAEIIVVNDGSYIWLIYSHSKGIGANHHPCFILNPTLLFLFSQ